MIKGREWWMNCFAMTRNDFKELAEVRIDEANALLSAGKYDGAYYLAGYAVECALKACIAKLTNEYDFPPKPKSIYDCYSHEIEKMDQATLVANQIDDVPRLIDCIKEDNIDVKAVYWLYTSESDLWYL